MASRMPRASSRLMAWSTHAACASWATVRTPPNEATSALRKLLSLSMPAAYLQHPDQDDDEDDHDQDEDQAAHAGHQNRTPASDTAMTAHAMIDPRWVCTRTTMPRMRPTAARMQAMSGLLV